MKEDCDFDDKEEMMERGKEGNKGGRERKKIDIGDKGERVVGGKEGREGRQRRMIKTGLWH